MDNYIAINTAQPEANYLKAACNRLRSALNDLATCKTNMDQTTDASTWTTLEAVYGLPAGKGQLIYNLVAGTVAETDADTNLQQLLSWTQAIG